MVDNLAIVAYEIGLGLGIIFGLGCCFVFFNILRFLEKRREDSLLSCMSKEFIKDYVMFRKLVETDNKFIRDSLLGKVKK